MAKTLYKKAFAVQAEKLTKLGAIDEELADFFCVSVTAINDWKKKYPEFKAALDAGKAVADNLVEQALFKRACGFSHQDTYFASYLGGISHMEYTKHLPPDTAACIFWLKNRKKEQWKDKPIGDGDVSDDMAQLFVKIAGMIPD